KPTKKEKIQRSKAEIEENLQKKNNSKAEVRSRGEVYKKEKIQRSKAEIEENLQKKKIIPKPKSKDETKLKKKKKPKDQGANLQKKEKEIQRSQSEYTNLQKRTSPRLKFDSSR